MRALGAILVLCLAGCSESEKPKPGPTVEFSQHDLAGRWLQDAQIPQCRVLSETMVDDEGCYVQQLTNVFSDGVRTATFAGTWRIQDGLLVETITNDFKFNTMVPRVAGISKIVRLDRLELVVTDTNNNTTVLYKRVSQ